MRDKFQAVKILDVRSREEYDQLHIPNAINFPIQEIELAEKTFNRSDILITVCGKGGGRSSDAAQLLKKLGYNAFWLCGGTLGWMEE